MYKIARFEKVSFEEFSKAFPSLQNSQIVAIYDSIKLPNRATAGSAGYDFFAPFDITLLPGESAKIPTGIRAIIDEGWFLAIFPRSGLGFKFRMQLDNTVGIIDSDYSNSENEGHIFCKITNDSRQNKTITIPAGTGFCQGIFLPFGITTNDTATGIRNGGFGSTDNAKTKL